MLGPLSAADISEFQAILYQRSGRAHVRSFVDNLLELGIRAIKGQDSYGARAALDAFAGVAVTYMDVRRASLVMIPDMDFPLLLQGKSGVEDVLVPIYAAVKSVNDEGMIEAAWDTAGQLAELLMGRQAKVHEWEADAKAVEILRNLVLWDYLSRPTPVVGVRDVEALLDAALHELQPRDGAKDHFFDVIIEALDKIAGPAAKISAVSFDL